MAQKRSNKGPQQSTAASEQPQMPREGNGHAQEENGIAPEAIAARAYDIYEREGRIDGHDFDHWVRAEAELKAEREKTPQRQEQHQQSRSPEKPGESQRPESLETRAGGGGMRPEEAPRSMRQTQQPQKVA